LGLFLADINILSTLLWSSIEKGNVAGIDGAHLLAVVAAGLFAALAIAALRGLLMNLPSAVFRPASVTVQTTLMALLVMALFLSPLLAVSLPALVRNNSPWFYYFQPIGSRDCTSYCCRRFGRTRFTALAPLPFAQSVAPRPYLFSLICRDTDVTHAKWWRWRHRILRALADCASPSTLSSTATR
jgi:hypothetical protein